MKEIKLEIRIYSLQYDELTPQDRELMDKAKEATSRSYAPYSKFSVGAAALLKNGVIVTGTNQENAAYPSGLCAERTTLFYANSQYPDQPVLTLAIAARSESGYLDTPIPPCGACRQVLLETEQRYHFAIWRKSDLRDRRNQRFITLIFLRGVFEINSLTLPHNGHTSQSTGEAKSPVPMIQGKQLPQQTVSAIRQARDTYGPALRSDR